MKSLSSKALIGTLLALAVAGAAAVPVVGALGRHAAPKQYHHVVGPRARVAVATAVDPAMAGDLAVLRGIRSAGDAMSPAAAGTIGPGAVDRFGANPGLSRKGTERSGETAFVVPGSTGLCLVVQQGQQGGGAGCAPAADAVAGNLLISVSDQAPDQPVHVVVAGLVPDGADSVTLTTVDGDAKRSAVSSNTFLFELDGQVPDRVSWNGPDGMHAQAVPY